MIKNRIKRPVNPNATMNYKRSNDNVYKTGTVITAKENPQRKLLIMKYIHRTYYCTVVGDALTQLTYFERDLIPPSAFDADKK